MTLQHGIFTVAEEIKSEGLNAHILVKPFALSREFVRISPQTLEEIWYVGQQWRSRRLLIPLHQLQEISIEISYSRWVNWEQLSKQEMTHGVAGVGMVAEVASGERSNRVHVAMVSRENAASEPETKDCLSRLIMGILCLAKTLLLHQEWTVFLGKRCNLTLQHGTRPAVEKANPGLGRNGPLLWRALAFDLTSLPSCHNRP
ncbi:hypothetical protein J6590_048595 [Homalodisca vitripennis]|nr:hypothetical protein J6590_048595 [Homalodisca vitripennis]